MRSVLRREIRRRNLGRGDRFLSAQSKNCAKVTTIGEVATERSEVEVGGEVTMLNELEQALGTLLAEPSRADLFAFCEAQFVADGSWQDLVGLYETFGAPFGPESRVDWERLMEQLASMAAALPASCLRLPPTPAHGTWAAPHGCSGNHKSPER